MRACSVDHVTSTQRARCDKRGYVYLGTTTVAALVVRLWA